MPENLQGILVAVTALITALTALLALVLRKEVQATKVETQELRVEVNHRLTEMLQMAKQVGLVTGRQEGQEKERLCQMGPGTPPVQP